MDFYGEIIGWDQSHKNHFYGTGPLILGPVLLNWDRSPGNVPIYTRFFLKIRPLFHFIPSGAYLGVNFQTKLKFRFVVMIIISAHKEY